MNNFFGSKLNTALLVFLIILMVIAIKIMWKNQDTYVPSVSDGGQEQVEEMDRSKLLGNKDDLVSFSIWPNSSVQGLVSYRGAVKGGYFFEGNILVGVADMNKKIILQSNAMATSEWMTADPVYFEGYLDFSKVPTGPAYIEIHNDNASGLPENDKSIFIPIVIE